MVLYHDLAPENWRHRRLSDQDATGRIMGLSCEQPSFAIAIQSQPLQQAAIRHEHRPWLVHDADSSQLSALDKIASGTDMVIQGPPGTGKSQTIANAVALAMSQGKTALVVAEKPTALQVVYQKLAAAGLTPFVLTADSQIANGDTWIDSLRDRYEMSRQARCESHSSTDDVELEPRLLEGVSYLESYHESLNTPLAPFSQGLAQLHGVLRAAKSKQVPLLKAPERLPVCQMEQYLNHCRDLERLQALLQELAPSLSDEPWHHPDFQFLSSFDADLVVSKLRSLQQVELRGNELEGFVTRELGLRMLGRQPWLNHPTAGQAARRLFGLVHDFSDKDAFDLHFRKPEHRRLMRKLIGIRKTMDLANCCLASNSPQKQFQPEALETVRQGLVALPGCFAQQPISILHTVVSQCEELLESVANLHSLASDSLHLDLPLPVTIADWRSMGELVQLTQHPAAKQIAEAWQQDHSCLPNWRSFHALESQAKALKDRRRRLERYFYWDSLPSADRLAEIHRGLRPFIGRWCPWLYPGYRRFRSELHTMARPKLGRRVAEWLTVLEGLVLYLQHVDQLTKSAEFQHTFGEHFRGLNSNWDDLQEMARVGQSLLDRFSPAQISQWCENTTSWNDRLSQWHEAIQQTVNLFEASVKHRSAIFTLVPWTAEMPLDSISHLVDQVKTAVTGWLKAVDDLRLDPSTSIQCFSQKLEKLIEREVARRALEKHETWSNLGSLYRGVSSDFATMEKMVAIEDCLTQIFGEPIADWTLPKDRPVLEALTQVAHHVAEFVRLLDSTKPTHAPEFVPPQDTDIGANEVPASDQTTESLPGKRRIDDLLQAPHRIPQWLAVYRLMAELRQQGLGPLLDAYWAQEIPASSLSQSYQLAIHQQTVDRWIARHPLLRDFFPIRHQQMQSQYREADRSQTTRNQQELIAKLLSRPIPMGQAGGRVQDLSELGYLRYEINKQKRHGSLRQMIRRASQTVLALKPCFLLSPLAVAEHLPANGPIFDLLIIDEASQVKPEHALGAILRARQVVVVGDSNQLPPTDFFEWQPGDSFEDDELTIAEEAESVLEVACQVFPMTSMLRWHFRSQHESLIQFSNEHFYDNQLVVFPSAHDPQNKRGLFLTKVEAGHLMDRVNRPEARCVVEAIKQHLLNYPEQSLGVGTMNRPQADFIRHLLHQACQDDKNLRKLLTQFDRTHAAEPLFIHNLENLQGDERDVMILSLTYGPDPESGLVAQRFGPLNTTGGWRRFNVMVTRARQRMEVLTSMKESDLRENEYSSRGTQLLADFLSYCEQMAGNRSAVQPPFQQGEPQRNHTASANADIPFKSNIIRWIERDHDATWAALRTIQTQISWKHESHPPNLRDLERLIPEILKTRGYG